MIFHLRILSLPIVRNVHLEVLIFPTIFVSPKLHFVFQMSGTLRVISGQRCMSIASFCQFEDPCRFWGLRNSLVGMPSTQYIDNADIGQYSRFREVTPQLFHHIEV